MFNARDLTLATQRLIHIYMDNFHALRLTILKVGIWYEKNYYSGKQKPERGYLVACLGSSYRLLQAHDKSVEPNNCYKKDYR